MNSESVPLVESSDVSVAPEILAGEEIMAVAEKSVPLVNYESEPLLEVELDGIDYRLDPGKQGTALCVSRKEPGSWDWEFVGEAKWDATSFRCKELERPVRESIGKALRELAEA
jgi:hypothetical protein